MSEDGTQPTKQVMAAFVVLVELDGRCWATDDLSISIDPLRKANFGDMYRACSEVKKDIQAIETAQRLMQLQASLDEEKRRLQLTQSINLQNLRQPGA